MMPSRNEGNMYKEFAGIYDRMMSEIPYDKWFQKLCSYLKRHGKESGHLCELGCGTGEMSRRFSDAGYEVTGIDFSPDMLAVAAQKQENSRKILYLNQDMTDFSLHKPADVVLCICDSINYLLEEDELLHTFCHVRDHLAEDGIFLFDMKTEYCFSAVLGNQIRVEDEEDYMAIWDNEYDSAEKINEYLLTMFLCGEDGRYDRYDECHRQRAYEVERVRELLLEAGLKPQDCFGEDMTGSPAPEDERIYMAAVRNR